MNYGLEAKTLVNFISYHEDYRKQLQQAIHDEIIPIDKPVGSHDIASSMNLDFADIRIIMEKTPKEFYSLTNTAVLYEVFSNCFDDNDTTRSCQMLLLSERLSVLGDFVLSDKVRHTVISHD